MIYGKEPFDLRLTMFCMCRRLPFIIAGTLLGTLLFGGGYYVKNVLLYGQRFYAATSTYRVEYAAEEKDIGTVYINQVSWNTYLQSQMFLDAVQLHLAETTMADGSRVVMNNEELGGVLQAFLASDLRVPSTTVTTENGEKSVWIARAVEAAMTQEFAAQIREIDRIRVVDPGDIAREVIPDVRVGRAFGLSAVLSGFFAVVLALLQITGEDSIWLPSSVWKRYGVKTVGTLKSRELAENLKYFFQEEDLHPQEVLPQNGQGGSVSEEDQPGAGEVGSPGGKSGTCFGRVAVCSVQEQVDSVEVLEKLGQVCPEIVRIQGDGETFGWFGVPAPLEQPEVCRTLREADGILLVVRAGRHSGRPLERVLEYLQQQDCQVTAVLLWEADEKLIKWYYGCRRDRYGGRQ